MTLISVFYTKRIINPFLFKSSTSYFRYVLMKTTLVKKRTSPYYPDIPLFLVLIPFISGFNYYLTYSNVKFNWWFIFTYTLDTLIGYVAWLGARKVILCLDHKMPYFNGFIKRVTLQFLLTTIVGLFVISFLTELSSLIVKGEWAHPSFYSHDLFIISIWFFVINAIYIMIHYYYKWQGTEEKVKSEKEKLKIGIFVKEGKTEIRLSFPDILGFSVEQDYIAVFTNAGKQYFLDSTLDRISSELPERLFFRLNRQYVINRNTIAGFQRRENGKLSVTLSENPSLPREIMVSRTKAPTFKRWFRNLD